MEDRGLAGLCRSLPGRPPVRHPGTAGPLRRRQERLCGPGQPGGAHQPAGQPRHPQRRPQSGRTAAGQPGRPGVQPESPGGRSCGRPAAAHPLLCDSPDTLEHSRTAPPRRLLRHRPLPAGAAAPSPAVHRPCRPPGQSRGADRTAHRLRRRPGPKPRRSAPPPKPGTTSTKR